MLPPHRRYKTVLQMVVQDINKALEKIYPKKRLWQITEGTSGRLTKLLVWSERFGVPLEYVLEVLLGYYYSTLPKGRQFKAKTSRSLGISVATLVGKQSFEILKENLAKDFPDGNNLAAWNEQEKERITAMLDVELTPKARSVLHYGSMRSFMDAYITHIEQQKKEADKLETKMKRIAWRGNPWR